MSSATASDDPPAYPVGPYASVPAGDEDARERLIADIAGAPQALRDAVHGLSAAKLDRLYRNWTIRQIVHHIADSHLNAYVRCKLALTEDAPTIRPYDEGQWSSLPESRTGAIEPSLVLLDGLHARWTQMFRCMTADAYERGFFHPEAGETVPLHEALAQYAWHGRHHVGQILWMRDHGRV